MPSAAPRHAAGFRTNRGSRVPTSRGQRRGDLEIKGLNVAGTPDLIVDVAIVHDFHGNVADPSRHGQPRHPNPDKVLIDTVVAKARPPLEAQALKRKSHGCASKKCREREREVLLTACK